MRDNGSNVGVQEEKRWGIYKVGRKIKPCQ